MTNHHYHATNDHANALCLCSVLNPTDIRKHSYNLRPHKMKGGVRFLKNILYFGSYKFS